MAEHEHLKTELISAMKKLRAASRAFRKQTGQPASKIMSGGAPNVYIDNTLLQSTVCRSIREHLLMLVPQGGVACEVGTSTGFFARAIVRAIQPSEMHLIDMDYNRFEGERYRAVSPSGSPFFHQGMPWEKLSKFEGFFDYIYIDAGHDYLEVKRDIAAALKAIKSTGYLMFNDYTRWSVEQAEPYGVHAAVNEMANQHRWAFRGIALSGTGHYDVLLSRATPEMDDLHQRMIREAAERPAVVIERYERKRQSI